MGFRRLWLPLLAVYGITHTAALADERRRDSRIRERIHQRLQTGQPTGNETLNHSRERQPRTRTRGTINPNTLPPMVIEHSRLFGEIIAAELDLPWGNDTDPKSSYFFLNDLSWEMQEKMKIWNELGYSFDAEGNIETKPTLIKLMELHEKAVAARGLNPKSMFAPVIVLYKSTTSVDDSGKSVEKISDYLFIDPLNEKLPSDLDSWKILTKDVEFNIPFDPIFRAFQAGKFPLLDAAHDISHFVAFLRFPDLTQKILSQLQSMESDGVSRAFKLRQYWLTEALSLLDPTSGEANRQFLEGQGRPLTAREPSQIATELEALTTEQLVDYALESARYTEAQLRDVSGGNSSPGEKWYYLSESVGMDAKSLLHEDVSRAPLDRLLELSETYLAQGPVTLTANPKKMTNETATFNFLTFNTVQKLLALLWKEGRIPVGERGTVRNALLSLTAKTEFMLSSPPATYRQWAQGFIQNNLAADHSIHTFLDKMFDHPLVEHLYLGEGMRRSEMEQICNQAAGGA